MTKNVSVLDEQGNCIGATYPKRAKGLVKHGRARFIDENVISLINEPACPPDIDNSEENTMDNNIQINDKTIDEIVKNAGEIEIDKASSANMNDPSALLSMIGKTYDMINEKQEEYFDRICEVKEILNDGVVDEDTANALKFECAAFSARAEGLVNYYKEIYKALFAERRFADRMNVIRDTYVSMFNAYATAADGCEITNGFQYVCDLMNKSIAELLNNVND